MKMKRYMVLLLLLALSFSAFSISEQSLEPQTVEPGEYGRIMLTVRNDDASNGIDDLTIDITSPSWIQMKDKFYIGDVAPSGEVQLTLPFKVESDAPTGIYEITIDVYGHVVENGAQRVAHKQTIIGVGIVNEPQLTLSLSRSEIGDIGEETIVIKNDGGIARKVVIKTEGEVFGFLNEDRVFIDEVADRVEVNVTIDARNAEDGPQQISFIITYEDALGNTYSEERSLPITVRKDTGNFVIEQVGMVVSSEEENIGMRIKNNGVRMEDVKIRFEDGLKIRGMSEYTVGDIEENGEREFSVPVKVDLAPGTHNIRVYVEWIENDKRMSTTKTLPIRVESAADVGVYLSAKPIPLTPKEEHTLSITVSNLGYYPVEAVTVEINGDFFELLNIEPEQYIGGLDPDDFSSVQYKIRINDVRPGKYPMNITVRYKDAGTNEVKERVFIREVYVSEVEEEEVSILPIVVLVIVAMAVVVWWFKVKKR